MQRQAAETMELLWKPKGKAKDGDPPPEQVREKAVCTYCAPDMQKPRPAHHADRGFCLNLAAGLGFELCRYATVSIMYRDITIENCL